MTRATGRGEGKWMIGAGHKEGRGLGWATAQADKPSGGERRQPQRSGTEFLERLLARGKGQLTKGPECHMLRAVSVDGLHQAREGREKPAGGPEINKGRTPASTCPFPARGAPWENPLQLWFQIQPSIPPTGSPDPVSRLAGSLGVGRWAASESP